MKNSGMFVVVSLIAGLCAPILRAQSVPAVQHVQTDAAPIATAVWANGLLFVSGQTASPITHSGGSKQGEPTYGDTKAQTISIFQKIDAILKT
jgi:enamine deaminase RidA (YjgF/YER057c/UK114 family)